MEEKEILLRAKTYIDKLANGINPLDDSLVKDDDIVNNVRISRCLFYVSGVLQQVIENGVGVQKKHAKKVDFFITQDAIEKIEYSDTPLVLKEFVQRINETINQDKVKTLPAVAYRGWLQQAGLLVPTETYQVLPTETGVEVGISLENRIGSKGEYTVVVYNRNAQEFIVNHLQEIANFQIERKINMKKAKEEK